MTEILAQDDDGLPFEEEEVSGLQKIKDILAAATAQTAEERRLKEARRRLSAIAGSGHPAAVGEAEQLLAEIRKLEDGRIWIAVGRIALFHVQVCATCDAKHEFFLGWMTEMKHISDKTARKLVREREEERPRLPERREDHVQGACECCANCVESVIAINIATGQSAEDK